MTTRIIEFPIVNGNLALDEKPISAAGQAAARPLHGSAKAKPRRRRGYRQLYITAALSLLIVTGLCFCFLAKGTEDRKQEPEATATPTASSGTSLPAITPAPPVEEAPEYIPDAAEVEALAKLIFGEAGVVPSTTEKAAVVWCVLNRVDDPRFPDTVLEVITSPYQFSGYNADNPVYAGYEALAADVLKRYHAERDGEANVGRVLPAGYCFFTGDGKHNHFTDEWKGTETWGWTLESPYDD